MTHIRRPLLGLLSLLVGAVTIDRFGLQGAEEGALAPWVYGLALGAVALPFLLPALRRARPWALLALAVGAYLAIKALLPHSPGLGAFRLHVAAVEAAVVGLAALLAHRLAAGLEGLDHALAAIGFGDYPALPLEGPQKLSR
ncbi:MAG: hypothetical protein FJW79_12280 [Actinobacteria bacterium]|nr:hypothetical protein [Actinomycetota bacterium]